MLGYITEKEAANMGFTHHGKYYGVPIWITDEECPLVAAKFTPFDFVMSAAQVFEGILNAVFFPDREPSFMFIITKEIEV